MAAESVQAQLAALTGAAGESSEEIYATWAGLANPDGDGLEALVWRKLTANAKAVQIRENLLSTIQAGGAVGESLIE
jgi:hypothetical protein